MNIDDQLATKLERPNSEYLNDILGVSFPVLDKGHIRVVDYMGNDAAVVQAARVSYGAGTKTPSDDETLIRYLMRNRHTTPFEMCELKLHIRMPMDAWRQMIRHRMASVNEYSTRYSEAIDDKQQTAPDQWRTQSTTNKQGSAEFLDVGTGELLSQYEREFQKEAASIYKARLDAGVAREQARKDLPLSTYTEAYWKIDLHNLLHFLSLRMDLHAQLEIRSYANTIGGIVAQWLPQTWGAMLDYRRDAMMLSALEVEALKEYMRNVAEDTPLLLENAASNISNKRERKECIAKISRLSGYDF